MIRASMKVVELKDVEGQRYPDSLTLAQFDVAVGPLRAFRVFQAALTALTEGEVLVKHADTEGFGA